MQALENIVHSSIITTLTNTTYLPIAGMAFVRNGPERLNYSPQFTTHHNSVNHMDRYIDIIILDFAKAYNKVPYDLLLLKLDHYGIRHNSPRWINSIVTSRHQQVIQDGAKSDRVDCYIQGPPGLSTQNLLLLTYINDLPYTIRSSITKLFADDSLLFQDIVTVRDSELLQEDLTALETWEKTWQTSFNPKCVGMRIAPRRHMSLETSYKLHQHLLGRHPLQRPHLWQTRSRNCGQGQQNSWFYETKPRKLLRKELSHMY